MEKTSWIVTAIRVQICTSIVLLIAATAGALTVKINDPLQLSPANIFYTAGGEDPLEFSVHLINEATESTDPILSWQLALDICPEEVSQGSLLFDSISAPNGSLFGEWGNPQLLSELPSSPLVSTDFDGSPEFEGVQLAAGATAHILSVQLSVSAETVGTFALTMRPLSAEDIDHSSYWLAAGQDTEPSGFFNEVPQPQMLILAMIHVTNETTLPGDFNKDLIVDAADYTVWRDGLDEVFGPGHYVIWKQNFGESLLESTTTIEVPEWSRLGLALVGFAISSIARTRRRS